MIVSSPPDTLHPSIPTSIHAQPSCDVHFLLLCEPPSSLAPAGMLEVEFTYAKRPEQFHKLLDLHQSKLIDCNWLQLPAETHRREGFQEM